MCEWCAARVQECEGASSACRANTSFCSPSPAVPSTLVFPSPAQTGTKHHGLYSTHRNKHNIPVRQPWRGLIVDRAANVHKKFFCLFFFSHYDHWLLTNWLWNEMYWWRVQKKSMKSILFTLKRNNFFLIKMINGSFRNKKTIYGFYQPRSTDKHVLTVRTVSWLSCILWYDKASRKQWLRRTGYSAYLWSESGKVPSPNTVVRKGCKWKMFWWINFKKI